MPRQIVVIDGATVTMLSDGPIGGRAGWHSLLPSKVWLTAADVLTPLAMAIQMQATADDLASLYPAHPTLSELVFTAARHI